MEIEAINEQHGSLSKEQIKLIIPYDEPFLFIDKVVMLDRSSIIALKNISKDEHYFKGHFVDFPIMPGALIIEGMGQTATLLVRNNIPNHKEKDILAYKIKDAVFKAPVFPGDIIRYEVNLIMQDERVAIAKGKAVVNEKVVSECLMMLAIVEKKDFRSKYEKKLE